MRKRWNREGREEAEREERNREEKDGFILLWIALHLPEKLGILNEGVGTFLPAYIKF